MKQTAVLAREKGVLLHTHLAETEDENDFCLEMFGMRPVDYLEEVNWLAGDAWLAHGIHFNETEIQRLGAAGTAVSHCPSSNMILASGIAPVKELNEAGVAVGLGVDGSASNDGSNMIQEVRQAFLIQRLRYGSANVSAKDALRWGTSGGAKLMHRNDIGEIAVGKQADLALFDLDQPRFSGQHDPLAALVVCGADHAEAVMVAGQWKVKDGQLVDGDLAEVMSKHRQAAQKLVNRA
jgi:8-oxoguanine deaminase